MEYTPNQSCSPFTSPLFLVADRDRQRYASLEAILTDSTIERFDYPFSPMNNLATLLATGLTGALLSEQCRTLETEPWLSLTTGEAPCPDRLFECCPAGFDLYGDIAFMQSPAQLFAADQPPSPIGWLLQPFVIGGETTKGLHHLSRRIRSLCSACALLALYGRHALSGAVSQYWSTAPTKESLIVTLSLHNAPLARTIWLNCLHATEKTAPLPGALPWVPDTGEGRGLNQDGSLPFEPWLRDQCRLDHPLALYFPLIRCLRLQHRPARDDGERCEACRNWIDPGQPMATGYRSLGEKTLFALLQPDTRAAMQRSYREYQKAIGVKEKDSCTAVDFKRMYDPAARHPHLRYQTAENNKPPQPINVSDFSTNVDSRRPVWCGLLSAEARELPAIVRQLRQLEARYDKAMQARIEPLKQAAAIELFGVRFRKGQDVSDITRARLRFGEIEGVLTDGEQANPARYAAPLIDLLQEKIIRAFVSAAKVLAGGCELDPAGGRYKLKKPARNMPADRDSPHLLECAEALWRIAFDEIVAIARCPTRAAKESRKSAAVETLAAEAGRLWSRYLDRQALDYPTLAAAFIEHQASKQFYKQVNKGVQQL